MSWRLKSFLLFMVIYNVAFSLADHLIADKTWAMFAFGAFAYLYGSNEKRIEAYFRG